MFRSLTTGLIAAVLVNAVVGCSPVDEVSQKQLQERGGGVPEWTNMLGSGRHHEMALMKFDDESSPVVILKPIQQSVTWRTVYFYSDKRRAIVAGMIRGRCGGKVMAPAIVTDIAWRLQRDICQDKAIKYIRADIDRISAYIAKGAIESRNTAPRG